MKLTIVFGAFILAAFALNLVDCQSPPALYFMTPYDPYLNYNQYSYSTNYSVGYTARLSGACVYVPLTQKYFRMTCIPASSNPNQYAQLRTESCNAGCGNCTVQSLNNLETYQICEVMIIPGIKWASITPTPMSLGGSEEVITTTNDCSGTPVALSFENFAKASCSVSGRSSTYLTCNATAAYYHLYQNSTDCTGPAQEFPDYLKPYHNCRVYGPTNANYTSLYRCLPPNAYDLASGAPGSSNASSIAIGLFYVIIQLVFILMIAVSTGE